MSKSGENSRETSEVRRLGRRQPRGQPIEPLAYSVDEAGRALSVGRDKIYQMIRAGDLTAVKAGKRTLIPRSSILAWLERAAA